jgi:hypothetical protein
MAQQREDWAAELARQYIEATLNVPVEPWDRDARQGAHDLDMTMRVDPPPSRSSLSSTPTIEPWRSGLPGTGYVRDSRLTRMWDVA